MKPFLTMLLIFTVVFCTHCGSSKSSDVTVPGTGAGTGTGTGTGTSTGNPGDLDQYCPVSYLWFRGTTADGIDIQAGGNYVTNHVEGTIDNASGVLSDDQRIELANRLAAANITSEEHYGTEDMSNMTRITVGSSGTIGVIMFGDNPPAPAECLALRDYLKSLYQQYKP
ncbi:MAG: hypothetical protein E3J72_09890 [Planctomycetota bacterium]|nr:MAG: hypothetical protein E3J72_09890 [Planctomycetota bacterium]